MGGDSLKGGSTRLDGLLSLLESGSNQGVRKMAAAQIGDLVAAHPSETRPVLRKVRTLLRSMVWETRVAAGDAISKIAEVSPRFTPRPSPSQPNQSVHIDQPSQPSLVKQEHRIDGINHQTLDDAPQLHQSNPSSILQCGLRFETLNIDRLMHSGEMLFGSTGDEYVLAQADVAQQRARLKADLGLGGPLSSDMDSIGVNDNDLVAQMSSTNISPPNGHHPQNHAATADVVAEMSSGNMSARERNRLKRLAKRKARDLADTKSSRPPKRPRASDASNHGENGREPQVFSLAALSNQADEEDEAYEKEFGADFWEFQATCEVLKASLLEPKWELRHGATIGLREILKCHASSAGRVSSGDLGDQENTRWLEDLCCRFLCVLAMDRFGDFVGDAVVAPVRETAAMGIGAASRVMSEQVTRLLVDRVFYLLKTDASSEWEVRHAALLGARYVLAVKDDMADELLRLSFGNIVDGLRDSDDDVRAVAAEALLPVASRIASYLPDQVPHLVTILWEALLDLDDISASTSSVFRLLSKLESLPVPNGYNYLWLQPRQIMDLSDSDNEAVGDDMDGYPSQSSPEEISRAMTELVPRLWPFLRHSSRNVRRAAVNLLQTLTEGFADKELLQWIQPLCAELFMRLFRNVLLETELDILTTSMNIWDRMLETFSGSPSSFCVLIQSITPMLDPWMHAASQESRAEAASGLDSHKTKVRTSAMANRRKAAAARRAAKLKAAKGSRSVIPQTVHDGDSAPAVEGPYDFSIMHQNVAAAIGSLAARWPSDELSLQSVLGKYLRSEFARARQLACQICEVWALKSKGASYVLPDEIAASIRTLLSPNANTLFAEMGMSAGPLFSDTKAFLDAIPTNLNAFGKDILKLKDNCQEGKRYVGKSNLAHAAFKAKEVWIDMNDLNSGNTWKAIYTDLKHSGMQKRRLESISALRMRLSQSITYLESREEDLTISTSVCAVAAIVVASGIPLPPKVGPYIKSLMAALRKGYNRHVQTHAADSIARLALRLAARDVKKAIDLMIKNLIKYLTAEQETKDEEIMASMISSARCKLSPGALVKRGALYAFRAFCVQFNGRLFSTLPSLWSRISGPLSACPTKEQSQEVVDALKILRAVVLHASQDLHSTIIDLISPIIRICATPHETYVYHAPLCLADVVAAMPGQGMQIIVSDLVPLLSGIEQDKDADRFARRGAAKALRAVVDCLGTKIIPYSAFLIVPMMTRMVDEDEIVREAAAWVFGTLVRLMPLEGGTPDDPMMSESMSREREEARSFLGQLLGSERRQHYELPVSIGDDIRLRKYQQECLDWLAFLNKYGLHGALCDDMGLGKTLMTLCILTGDYATNMKKDRHLPSLVICPSTIVAHWVQEADRFFGHVLRSVIHYAGLPKARARIRSRSVLRDASLIVTSYDILSNDLRYFEHIRWNYIVLDEGHVIKNAKTKAAKAVRSLSSNHRLILTGTPIQNSVIELWAMFDFLMPGFLGSEKSFKDTYAKPIMAAREGKCSETDQEKGMAATESLHRQVLPFVLRRLKDDVLSELPPKIMQDYYCNMTPIQLRLYEDFSSDISNNPEVKSNSRQKGAQKESKSHVFQALSYLRRLCSHPKLVLSPKHPEYHSVHDALHRQGRSIDDIESSAKLLGLRNILQECGIGLDETTIRDSGGHRVLIFAQLKQMLDIVEKDLFGVHMPNVTYMRLDGTVEATRRQSIVTRFNADPTIDCLLLTTHVGGLGLNLTGADTVIFLEHDWNPTKDLQAMDRAHRLGQKRTVNVYRLITRGTLEEKIMSIQKFKTHIANAVVNRENSNLQSMNTEDLLDLFKVDSAEASSANDSSLDISVGTGKGMKAALAGLGELWEEKQYEDEYNMDNFLAGMDTSGKT
ncbi:putative helicase mot1 [Gracilariopsis chorda]|uniref:Putative helicase mot1 n=1 Tax=Gracilariopsis chorda TaxID=448386 RepID=A0A2V3J3U7_9FLOR|nr:putative helicase mot1 [Gracilariopsis chorda]|eukprot:PXF49054.1 putative helicase mot1 [Gracilariopsis chorda]